MYMDAIKKYYRTSGRGLQFQICIIQGNWKSDTACAGSYERA